MEKEREIQRRKFIAENDLQINIRTDVWRLYELHGQILRLKTVDFTKISQPSLRYEMKFYLKYVFESRGKINIPLLCCKYLALNTLVENNPNIKFFADITETDAKMLVISLERTTKDEEKESNGKFDLGEMLLSGIEVTLYEEGGNPEEPVKLIPNDDGSINHNPTVTDEQGRYIFRNVDPMKTYYVEFKYNGVEYETTKEGAPAEYNSEEWMTSAKAVQEGEPDVDTKVIDKRDIAYNYEELSTLYAEISALALKHIRTNTTEQLDMEKIRQQVEEMHQDGVEEGNPKQDPEIKKKMQFILNQIFQKKME